jgi:hypothetical protein
MLRGGNFFGLAVALQAGYRYISYPYNVLFNNGFRFARTY